MDFPKGYPAVFRNALLNLNSIVRLKKNCLEINTIITFASFPKNPYHGRDKENFKRTLLASVFCIIHRTGPFPYFSA